MTSGYAPQPGLPGLRTAFAADLTAACGATIDATDTLITAGCNQAFCTVISALAGPGDNVVLALPFYFNHDMWLRVEGIAPRYLSTDERLYPAATDAATIIDDRTRAIVLVTPGNPSGVTYPPELIDAFADVAVEHGVALLVDETYRSFRPTTDPAHRLYDRADWRDHVITLHSFSKDLAIPGYRVGGLIAGEAARIEALKVLDCVAISAPVIGQAASATGLMKACVENPLSIKRNVRILNRTFTAFHQRPDFGARNHHGLNDARHLPGLLFTEILGLPPDQSS